MKKNTNVTVYTSVFSETQIDFLKSLLPPNERKIRFNVTNDSSWPQELLDAKETIQKAIPEVTNINTAILKRYTVDDESSAYTYHKDPEEFATQPLVLVTLSGEAEFYVEGYEGIPVSKGTILVLLDPTLSHKVTPPTNDSGERYFLFFRFSTEV